VIESVRAEHGNDAVGRLYSVYGEHIHHRQDSFLRAETALAEVDLPAHHATAFDDESFDAGIRTQMDDGLSLTGNDVGTPILGFVNDKGTRVGFFGPIISRRLSLDDGLKLWDGLMLTANIDAFWELKRTRTESPNFDAVG
jgi:hypothetical protein